MNKQSLACCYFPNRTIFVDDRKEYLDSLAMILDPDISYDCYTDPERAIKFLSEDYRPTPYINKWVSSLKDRHIDLGKQLEENSLTHYYTDIDISAIHKEIYSPIRFREISLVVVDYSMPRLNGLEFCERLKDSPVKKLLVTGEAGYKLGVEAMNNKLIDAFISKNEEDFDEQLHNKIRELQRAYFCDLSAGIMHNLKVRKSSCLGDPEFATFFNKLCKKHDIAEYYLVNDSGSFLLLTNDGKISWLVVKSEQELGDLYSMALDNDGPSDIIESFKNREKLLFHFTREDAYANSIEDWRKYIYPAKKLDGVNNHFYYAYLNGISDYDINENKIYSYNKYMDEE